MVIDNMNNLRSIILSFSLLFFTLSLSASSHLLRSLPLLFHLSPPTLSLPYLLPIFSPPLFLLHFFSVVPNPSHSIFLTLEHIHIHVLSFSSNLSLTLYLSHSFILSTHPSSLPFLSFPAVKIISLLLLSFPPLSISSYLPHTHIRTFIFAHSNDKSPSSTHFLTSSTHSSHRSVSFPFSHTLSHQRLLYFFPLSLSSNP